MKILYSQWEHCHLKMEFCFLNSHFPGHPIHHHLLRIFKSTIANTNTMITAKDGGVVRLDAAEFAALSDNPSMLPGRLPDVISVPSDAPLPPAAPPAPEEPGPDEPEPEDPEPEEPEPEEPEPDEPEETEELEPDELDEPEDLDKPDEPDKPEDPDEPEEPALPPDDTDSPPPGIAVCCNEFSFLGLLRIFR